MTLLRIWLALGLASGACGSPLLAAPALSQDASEKELTAPTGAQDELAARAQERYDELLAAFQADAQRLLDATDAMYRTEEYLTAYEKRDVETVNGLRAKLPVVDYDGHADRFLEAASEFAATEHQYPFLAWVFWNAKDPTRFYTAVQALLAEHIADPRLVKLTRRLERRVGIMGHEAIVNLATLLIEECPITDVRAQAHYARGLIVQRARSAPWLTPELAAAAAGDFAKVLEIAPDSVVAYLIQARDFERERLQIGMVAPEIIGEDLDGKTFKLSDYRGRVVLLDFWADEFDTSRKIYPHERSLVKRLADRPFVLLGVNHDMDREALKPRLEEENITWRSFWNGDGGTYGPIAARWNVTQWPTLYILDHEGVIRFKGPENLDVDRAVGQLLLELEESRER